MTMLQRKLVTFLAFIVAVVAEGPIQVDFVIVGAGTAGCALAGRLCTALPHAKIVLLERGFPRDEETEFQIRSPRNLQTGPTPEAAEFYESEPNQGLLGKTSVIVTGKTLGGSSSINGMQWTVPVGRTVDSWNIKGLTSRTWKRYLRRAFAAVGFAVPRKPLRQVYTNDYINAGNRAGFPTDRRRFADETRKRMWLNRLAIDKAGRRTDSCTAYVKSVLNTKCKRNLRLIQSATVTRLLLDSRSPPRAYGVEYVKSDGGKSKKREILAKRTLLTAGPFESPKLLQLSGIGPRRVLEKAGVKVRVDLPVGRRTQARSLNSVVSLYEGVPLEPSNNLTVLNLPETRKQFERGEGGLFGVAVTLANGIMEKLGYFTSGFGITPAFILTEEPILGSTCIGNTKSFGYLRIKDNNPLSPPSVQLNVLGKRSDVKRLLECMKNLERIHSQFSREFEMRQVVPTPGGLNEFFIRNTSTFALHFVGGCRVDTVVTRSLNVKGVKGLRVIDTSIFKKMPISAGPLASTYMLAEFMAEKLIKMYK